MRKSKASKLVKITTNNQVAIPAFIVRDLGLTKGTYLQVEEKGRQIVMTPRRVVSEEDFSLYEQAIKKGRAEFEKGKTADWEDVKKKASRSN